MLNLNRLAFRQRLDTVSLRLRVANFTQVGQSVVSRIIFIFSSFFLNRRHERNLSIEKSFESDDDIVRSRSIVPNSDEGENVIKRRLQN